VRAAATILDDFELLLSLQYLPGESVRLVPIQHFSNSYFGSIAARDLGLGVDSGRARAGRSNNDIGISEFQEQITDVVVLCCRRK
jgi:hypothetical protein